MAGGTGLIAFSGTVWRMIFAGRDPRAPVRSPEGRFHHSGQRALYTSLTPEGTAVAIRRYVAPGDPPRAVVALVLAPLLYVLVVMLFFDDTRRKPPPDRPPESGVK